MSNQHCSTALSLRNNRPLSHEKKHGAGVLFMAWLVFCGNFSCVCVGCVDFFGVVFCGSVYFCGCVYIGVDFCWVVFLLLTFVLSSHLSSVQNPIVALLSHSQ